MHAQIILLSLVSGALASVFHRAACNADNCARAVTGTRYAPDVQALHTADCSSFMMETITPATPIATVTLTGTSYSVIGSNAKRTAAPAPLAKKDLLKPRDAAGDALLVSQPSATYAAMMASATGGLKARQVTVLPNSVPIYASACSGVVRYSSACSCAGITVQTTYAPTPATSTTTVYAQQSVIPVCDPNQNYGINYLGGSIVGDVTLDPEFIATDAQGCCAACYAEGSGCYVYEILGPNICLLGIESSGGNTPTDYCPYGVFGLNTSPGAFYGVGPCAAIL